MMRRNPLDRTIAGAAARVHVGTGQGIGAANGSNQAAAGMNATGEGTWVPFGLLDVTVIGSFRLAGPGPDEWALGRLDLTLLGAPFRLAPARTSGKLDVTRLTDPFVLA